MGNIMFLQIMLFALFLPSIFTQPKTMVSILYYSDFYDSTESSSGLCQFTPHLCDIFEAK